MTFEKGEQEAEVLLSLDQGGPATVTRPDVLDEEFTSLRGILFKHIVAEVIGNVTWNLGGQVWRVKTSWLQHV